MPASRCLVLLLPLLLGLAGCRDATEVPQGVTWPELTAFDELAATAEGLAQVGDLAALRAMVPRLVEVGAGVSAETQPGNASHPAALTEPLRDLAELLGRLATVNLSDDDLRTYTLALHPLVTVLMREAGLPHVHANEGPHGGFLHPLFAADGRQAGTLEIKLHDDAGDLEVWLVQGGREGPPMDLPLDSVLRLQLPDLQRELDLRVRDREQNAGEDGTSNVRQGLTNYFIFPGETGADAAWLQGASFAAKARLQVPGGLATEIFVLKPHVHR